jgi:hypothetical protein
MFPARSLPAVPAYSRRPLPIAASKIPRCRFCVLFSLILSTSFVQKFTQDMLLLKGTDSHNTIEWLKFVLDEFFCKITLHDCAESGRRQRYKGQKLGRQHHHGHSKFIMLGIVSVETDLRQVNEDLFSSFF